MAAAARRTSSALSGLGRLIQMQTRHDHRREIGFEMWRIETIHAHDQRLGIGARLGARSSPDSSARASPFFSSATASSKVERQRVGIARQRLGEKLGA